MGDYDGADDMDEDYDEWALQTIRKLFLFFKW
jgi:hypothetical protein